MKAYAGSRSGIKLAAIPHADMWYFIEDRSDGFRIYREHDCILNLDLVYIDNRAGSRIAKDLDRLFDEYTPVNGKVPVKGEKLLKSVLLDTAQTFEHYFERDKSN